MGGLNWNDVAQHSYREQADVNTVMNLLVP